jgi:hypothetical protein
MRTLVDPARRRCAGTRSSTPVEGLQGDSQHPLTCQCSGTG